MLFVELRFFLTFGLAFVVYWTLRGDRMRKLWLLAVSYGVYAAWDWRYLSLILASTVIDWFAGQGALEGKPHRKLWLMLSLCGNLGMLGFFKYFNFFIESGSEFLRLLGLSVDDHTLAIVLPVGISFYTFQTLSYTIDIYRGRLEPTRHFSDLALFVAFFPQLVAGPIVRAVQFMPQLAEKRSWAQHVDVRGSLAIFFFGFVKKTVVSDHFSPLVDQVFSAPGEHTTASVWLGAVLFDLQIYCDFSGYSDMAIGLAGLLGYKLPRNFLFPYFSKSLTSFWQRWHMTLGAWFTDYVYFPLGGNRISSGRTRLNILLVFLVSGLWHGAAWTFIVWGAINGLVALLERGRIKDWLANAAAPISFLYLNVLMVHTWTIFRAGDFGTCAEMFRRFYGFGGVASDVEAESIAAGWWLAALGFFIVHGLMYRFDVLERVTRLAPWKFAVLLGLGWALVLPWIAAGYTPFIYFQF